MLEDVARDARRGHARAKSIGSSYSCEIANAGQLLITASIAADTVPE